MSDQRFIQDPYATTFGGFSKVTNFFRVALRPPDSTACSRSAQDGGPPPQPDDEPGFELITCVREASQRYSVVSVSFILRYAKNVCFSIKGVELGPRPDVSRGPPLDRWEDFLDSEGRVKSPERIRELVFRGVSLKAELVQPPNRHSVPDVAPVHHRVSRPP